MVLKLILKVICRCKCGDFFSHIGKDKIWEDNEEKPLGITIDSSLRFDTHIDNICAKDHNSRVGWEVFQIFEQRIIIFKSFFESQFKYCF